MYSSITAAVLENSRRFPEKIAVADKDRQYTYCNFAIRAYDNKRNSTGFCC